MRVATARCHVAMPPGSTVSAWNAELSCPVLGSPAYPPCHGADAASSDSCRRQPRPSPHASSCCWQRRAQCRLARRDDTRIVIEGERIHCVGPRDQCPAPAGARRLDGRGRFVIPGLFDAYVHTSQRLPQVAPLYLAFGITSVRDVGFPEFTRWLQDEI